MSRIIGVRWVLAAAMIAGCHRADAWNDGQTLQGSAQTALLEELARKAAAGTASRSLPSELVQVQRRDSRAVPGLTLYFAEYHPPERLHQQFAAMAGERRGRVRIIRNHLDYVALAGTWLPSTSSEAVAACEEAVTAEAEAGRADAVTFFRRDGAMRNGFLPEEWERIAARAEDSAAHRTPSGWEVTVWSLRLGHPRGAIRFDCRLPVDRALDWTLARVDSTVFPDIPH